MTPDVSGATELRLRAAVESSPSGLLMMDARGLIVLVNREVERLFGYPREELLGKPVEVIVPERLRAEHSGHRGDFLADPRMRAMGSGRELSGRRKDGTEVRVEIGLTPVATDEGLFVLASIVDITFRMAAEAERRRLEDELRQAQKLEALGTLAGGIAHDFNNILFGIVGYAELVGKDLRTPQGEADLAELLKAAARGRELIERIMVFSRRETTVRHAIAMGPTVAEAAKLLRAILPATIEVSVRVDEAAPRILGDATSIHQVLMNLGTNAAHAMPEGGVIEIALESQYLRDSVARSHPGLHEGPYALLTVRDTGSGMPREVLQRAFEPFFTTKGKGVGTGLGLSMVHSIVKAHEGAVELTSVPGMGTTVTCFFPALGLTPAEERAAAGEPPLGEGERVLLVEDELSLASMNARRLAELGYQVTAETDPELALERVRAHPDGFDLVITDYLMPRLLGVDLAREIRAVRPDLPVMLLTGFIENLSAEAIGAACVRRVLKKPVTLRELAVAVREVLARAPAG